LQAVCDGNHHWLPLFGGSMGALFHSLAFFFCCCFALAVRFLAAPLDADAALPMQPSDCAEQGISAANTTLCFPAASACLLRGPDESLSA